jgi:transposase
MNIIGIDFGKAVFHLAVMDRIGAITGRKRLSRPQLLAYLANAPSSLVAMEASCGAYYLGRLVSQGNEVRLIRAQFVRPFVKSQKNDYVDAEAIAEAVQRPTMRFVLIKT